VPFAKGSLGYAASEAMQVGQGVRISNDSQFFIVKTDSPHLTGRYARFGQVTQGMDVVENIQKGDKILSITIQ
jgi:cyclophilin family peptidyl-prolyl cis-trans isomerase